MSLTEKGLTLFGLFFIFLGIISSISAYVYSDITLIFWFCYLSIPIAGIGMLLRNTNIIKSQLYILTIPDLIWGIDFITYLILGNSLLGTSDYFFQTGPIIPKIITIQHLFIIPLMFYILLNLEPKKENSWKISIIQMTLIFILTRLFTKPEYNINCAFDLCGKYSLELGNYYIILWFIMSALMIYISRVIFTKITNIIKL